MLAKMILFGVICFWLGLFFGWLFEYRKSKKQIEKLYQEIKKAKHFLDVLKKNM